MIYISGPLVGITHECYFMIVDLDLLTCGIVDASATCSWASSPLGMIMALTEHRFHPFSLSFSATWLSPSSHRVTAKSYTDLRRMELERGKKCADVQMLVPSHARKTQLISQAARTCENTDFTTNITTWFPDCGQTLPWGGARPVSIRHFFLWNQVFYCTMEIDIAWHGPWLHFLLRFRSRWFVWSTFWPFLWSPVSAAGLRATRSSQKRSQNTWKSEGPHV